MHRKIDFEGILTVYDLFYQILKINIARFESLVMKLVIESKNCMDFSYEISYKELSDYQIRMSKAERELIYLMGIIKPKKKIIKTLLNLFSETRFYLVYLNGLSNRLKKIVSSLISSKNTLKAAKVLYHTCADDTLSRTGISSGEIMKFFAGMTTIFMPIASIESMWGQNMKVPGKDITDLRISAVFFSCFTIWIFFSVLYFKRIRWF
jgi:Mg2+ and Co2+ transporter CorA